MDVFRNSGIRESLGKMSSIICFHMIFENCLGVSDYPSKVILAGNSFAHPLETK